MKRRVDNQRIADALAEMGLYLDAQDVAFKPRAYATAAQTIRTLDRDAIGLVRTCGVTCLDDLPGIGAHIAAKIVEMTRTGRIKEHAAFKKKFPFDMLGIASIPGVGPKTALLLWRRLKAKSVKDVARLARTGKIAALRGFGEKRSAHLLEGLAAREKRAGRALLHDAWPFAQHVVEALRAVPAVAQAEIAGSLRRRKETVGDLDFVAASRHPSEAAHAFTKLPGVVSVVEEGPGMARVRFTNGLGGDLRLVEPKDWAAGLHHFTGSKEHNVQLRTLAEKKGWKISEYGLFRHGRRVPVKTERDVYRAFGMDEIPPELRQGRDELEAAAAHRLPKLVGYDDIRGDLQVQTDWTDGRASLEEMARAAKARGLSYIAITDHTHSLSVTHGLDARRLAEQGTAIDALNASLRGFRVLKSTECDVLKDGSLDLPDDALAALDLVCISVHTNRSMDQDAMTERVIRAMRHPLVNVLFHPTGRIVNRREPYKLDFPRILRAAKEYGVALEVNASDRLDLSSDHVREAVRAGAKLVVDSDAHAPEDLANLPYGIAQARRGWAAAGDVLNTKPVGAFLKALKGLKKRRA